MNKNKPLLLLFTGLTLALTACAHSIDKYNYPPTTNATGEIERLEGEMNAALKDQINVLSPNHYADAREKLNEAKKDNQERESNEEVLEELGYARAHLDAAKKTAPKVLAALPEVVAARTDALEAEAPRLRSSELVDADRTFKKVAQNFENENPTVSAEKRTELEKMYIDLAVSSTKASYLGEAKALIETAKNMGAKKYATSTLADAEVKYQSAEKTIETQRQNTAAITAATSAATAEAKRAVEITRSAKGLVERTPEEVAIALESKRNEATRNATRAEMAQKIIQEKNSEISVADARSSMLENKNSGLENRAEFNRAFSAAQKSFAPAEAEVYRKGDQLIVRLKGIQFKTGQAALPGESMDILAKVKDVITSMDAEKILVEGHTDASGSKTKNLELSEKRAESVANYFVSEQVVPTGQVATEGFGDTRPIVSNKTKDGRAQNRRVDVIISPKHPTSNN